MPSNKCHNLLQYSDDDKKEIFQSCGLKEEIIEEDIDFIIDWFNKQPHLVEAGIDRDVIERLLITSKGSRERTKERINNLYKFRAIYSEVYENRESILNKERIWTWYRQVIMPKLYNGVRVSIIQITDPDPYKFQHDFMAKMTNILLDFRLKYDCMKSDIWVIDLKNTGIGHVPRLDPMIVQKSIRIFQEGIGLRIAGIHVLNSPPVAQSLLSMIKQHILPKILERITFHESIEELHKYVPKDYLPEDYGGSESTMGALTEQLQKELCSEEVKKYLLDSSKRMSNESIRRLNGKIENDPLSGSFKKLDLD